MKILILGGGGFIGSHLIRAILERTSWSVYALDRTTDRLAGLIDHPRLSVEHADVADSKKWILKRIAEVEVCLPLVASATPAAYVRDPLGTFDLNFSHNLEVVRWCAASGTRLIFPSSSEVYGLCSDEQLDEYASRLVYGPVHASRWIYASSKQLLERIIIALAAQHRLRFTLFRPFNWVGPGLDSPDNATPGASRVVSQFLGHLGRREPITLVDGGFQHRCFTHVDDGIRAVLSILANPNNASDGLIFNLGNPENDRSIRDLANVMIHTFSQIPGYEDVASTPINEEAGESYYGAGYEDVRVRVPDIRRARELLAWSPVISFEELIRSIITDYTSTLPVK